MRWMLRALLYLILSAQAIAGTFAFEGRKVTIATLDRGGTVYFQLDPVLGALGLLREPYRAGKGFQVAHQDRLLVLGTIPSSSSWTGKFSSWKRLPCSKRASCSCPPGFSPAPWPS